MANPIGPDAILQGMAAALPTHKKGDTTSDMSSSYEALALFTHSCMKSLGFRLLGFNEDNKIGEQLPAKLPSLVAKVKDGDSANTPPESECQSLAPRLPSTWNSNFNSHSFLYAHTQSSMHFVIKIDRMGGKAEIRGLGVGDDRIHRLEVTARDYISSAALPLRITTTAEGEEDRSDLPEKLEKVFISKERMADLASLLKINIIQKLVPSLQKEGYQEDADDRAAREDAEQAGRVGQPRQPPQMPEPMPDPARPYPFNDPLAGPRRPPVPVGEFGPPGFEDEYEINRPPRGGPLPGLGGMPGQSPFGIGHDDLYPPGLGPNDPLRGSFTGGGGLPRPGGGGGMHPTLDDPLFGGPRGGQDPLFDPQVPPGARWDDPSGGNGGLGPRFGGGRPRGTGPGGNPGGFGFGGDII